MQHYSAGQKRRQQILDAAIQIANTHCLDAVSANKIMGVLKLNRPVLVFYYFKSIIALKKEILRVAIEQENLKLLAQFVVCKPFPRVIIPTKLKIKLRKYMSKL